MTIPDDWTPTAANINALPKPVREYIMRLSTDEKRAGLIAKVQILEGQLAAMNRMLEEAPEVEVQSADPPGADYLGFIEAYGSVPSIAGLEVGKRVKLVVVDE